MKQNSIVVIPTKINIQSSIFVVVNYIASARIVCWTNSKGFITKGFKYGGEGKERHPLPPSVNTTCSIKDLPSLSHPSSTLPHRIRDILEKFPSQMVGIVLFLYESGHHGVIELKQDLLMPDSEERAHIQSHL